MKILVPVDSETESMKALDFGIQRVKEEYNARLHVVHINTDPDVNGATGSVASRVKTKLNDAEVNHKFDVVNVGDVGRRSEDRIGDMIVEILESENYDEVVLGNKSKSNMREIMFGSVTEQVIQSRITPVTLVP